MSALAAAVRFLTVVPVAGRTGTDPRAIARSPAFFPLVGVGIGLALAGLDRALLLAFPAGVSAAIVIAAGIALTGALHLDGLADTADGLFGGRTPERRLAIMREPAVGVFGAAAIGASLLIRWASIAALASTTRFAALVAAPALGRWAALLLLDRFAYLRGDGLASAYSGPSAWRLLFGAATALAASYLLLGLWGLTLIAGVTLLSLVTGIYASRRLGGGLTGDVYGAASEIGELATLVGVVALTARDLGASPFWS